VYIYLHGAALCIEYDCGVIAEGIVTIEHCHQSALLYTLSIE